MTKVYVYNGEGAVGAKDLEKALEKLNISFERVKEKEIEQKKLEKGCLIIPGGLTEKYISLKEVYPEIREFVFKGGKYIGICAGAYLAPKYVILPKGQKFKGLNIINLKNLRLQRTGGELKEVSFKDKKLKVWYENGPLMIPERGIKILAKYKNGFASLVKGKYGKGSVILFSFHPEGSIKNRIEPLQETLNLLKKAIEGRL